MKSSRRSARPLAEDVRALGAEVEVKAGTGEEKSARSGITVDRPARSKEFAETARRRARPRPSSREAGSIETKAGRRSGRGV